MRSKRATRKAAALSVGAVLVAGGLALPAHAELLGVEEYVPVLMQESRMDLEGAKLAYNTPVQIWRRNGSPAQFWGVHRVGDDHRAFISRVDPLQKWAITLPVPKYMGSVKIQKWVGGRNQMYDIWRNGFGDISFLSVHPDGHPISVRTDEDRNTHNGWNLVQGIFWGYEDLWR